MRVTCRLLTLVARVPVCRVAGRVSASLSRFTSTRRLAPRAVPCSPARRTGAGRTGRVGGADNRGGRRMGEPDWRFLQRYVSSLQGLT